MAAKKRLHPSVRQQLETALLEALRRHGESRGTRRKKKAPARKKAGKKKTGRKSPARKRTGRRKKRA